jgi:predicted ester cyclase
MPDIHVTIEDMIAEGDRLACRWECSGTHQVDFFGIPATGKKATWTGVTIYRFDSGKIVEAWWAEDALGMLQQLGIIPTE